jgi:hypothetical protein
MNCTYESDALRELCKCLFLVLEKAERDGSDSGDMALMPRKRWKLGTEKYPQNA